MKTNTKPYQKAPRHNKLWQGRERAGLERKQVALLSGKTVDEISRYERGLNKPNLQTALKFEIIYRMPVKLLFPELFRKLEIEIAAVPKCHSFPDREWFPSPVEKLNDEEFCFYRGLLKDRIPNELEIETVVKHVVNLMKIAGNYRGKPSFTN